LVALTDTLMSYLDHLCPDFLSVFCRSITALRQCVSVQAVPALINMYGAAIHELVDDTCTTPPIDYPLIIQGKCFRHIPVLYYQCIAVKLK